MCNMYVTYTLISITYLGVFVDLYIFDVWKTNISKAFAKIKFALQMYTTVNIWDVTYFHWQISNLWKLIRNRIQGKVG